MCRCFFTFSGDRDNRQEEPELVNRLGELGVVDGLGDADVATDFVAALDFPGVVGRGQDNHRDYLCPRVALHAGEHLIAVQHGHIQVEQHEYGGRRRLPL